VEKYCGSARQKRFAWSLQTSAFAKKASIRLGDPRGGACFAFLKAQANTARGCDGLERECANLALVRSKLEAMAVRSVDIPRPLGSLRIGSLRYCLESASRGLPFSCAVFRPGYFRDKRAAEADFTCVTERVIDLTEMLGGIQRVGAIPSQWRDIPAELRNCPALHGPIEAWRHHSGLSANSHGGWIQHGDLSVENVFFDSRTGCLEVIDWADLSAGFPALYDLFCLFYSTGYLPAGMDTVRFQNEEDRWMASFHAIFVSERGFGRCVRQLVLRACERLDIASERVADLVVEFLLVRTHYYRNLSPVQCCVHLRLLKSCFEDKPPLLGYRPLGLSHLEALSQAASP
jgi:hypothetical protein